MKETHSHNWIITFLVYAVVCIISLIILYWVIHTFFPETSSELIPLKDSLSSRFIGIPHQTPSLHIEDKKITLPRDQELLLERAKLIYRGIEDDSFLRIDVALLDLDPDYYYKHRISIDEAKRGITLGGKRFRVLSAKKSALHLKIITREPR